MKTELDTKKYLLPRDGHPLIMGLAMVFLVWILLRILFFVGFQWKDDFYYIHYALFWNGYPTNHWEARYLFNAMLRLSFTLFGYSEWTATLPALMGSFLILISTLWITWHQWRNLSILICAGLLIAFLPIDVRSMVVSPRVLGTGLFAMGTAFFFTGEKKRSWITAGFLYGLSICVHVTMIFSIGAVMLVSILFWYRKKQDFALLFFTLVLTYCVMDFGVYALWTGDPFHHVHCIQNAAIPMLDQDAPSRYWIDKEGHFQIAFFMEPVRQLFFSNKFGLLSMGLLAGFYYWKRIPSIFRILLLSSLLLWGWISFGSFTLTTYRPMSIDFDFLKPLGFLLALVVTSEIALIDKIRTRVLLVSILLGASLILLLLTGSWAKQFDISRELLDYTQNHPEMEFVADDLVLEHMALIRGFKPIPNVWSTPLSRDLPFSAAKKCTETEKSMHVLVNPMTTNSLPGRWIQEHQGRILFQSRVSYRPLFYLLPEPIREKYPWTIQKPSAMICELDSAL